MREQGLIELLRERLCLNMTPNKKALSKWKAMANRFELTRKKVQIGLVGKYTKLEDAYASVIKALQHACLAANRKLCLNYIPAGDLEDATKGTDPVKFHDAWKLLCQCDGEQDWPLPDRKEWPNLND